MPYKLHAVLVHEGEALSGHYWCFVKQRVSDYSNAQTPAWLKFNDTQVSWADKSHMQTESFGGGSGRVGGSDSGTQKGCRQLSCSAYCLIYIDTASNDIFGQLILLYIPGSSGTVFSRWTRRVTTAVANAVFGSASSMLEPGF